MIASEFKISVLIGTFLGLILALIPNLIVAIGACVLGGFLSVVLMKSRLKLYALSTSFMCAPWLCWAYGFEKGLVYSGIVIFGLSVVIVPFFAACGNAFDNVKFLREKWFGT